MNADVSLNYLLFDRTKKYFPPPVGLLHPSVTTITSRPKGALFKPLLPLKAAALREKDGGKKWKQKPIWTPGRHEEEN